MKKALLTGVVVLVVALPVAWFAARPAYRQFRETRSVRQAKTFMANRDFRNASLSARQALLANPQNLDACRMMAELADLAQSTNTLEWLKRIAASEPTPENQLRLAAAGLRYQPPPFPLAGEILTNFPATNLPAYHTLAAEYALKLRRGAEAILHFETASRLEPTNLTHRLNLAILNLSSTDNSIATAARQELENLRSDPDLAPVALRWLLAESLHQTNFVHAQAIASQLTALPAATLEDHLQLLHILHQTRSPDLQTQLTQTQTRASTNAPELYALCAWMLRQGMTNEALQFVTESSVRTNQPGPMALVDCYVAHHDWETLGTFLLNEKWGRLEFLRLAFLSRAAAEQRQPQAADIRWRSAIREAGNNLGQLNSLLAMATAWGRDQAREDLLWHIARRFPRERWALLELDRTYTAQGNTLGLNKVYNLMMDQDPRNFAARNNYAATCLLLNLNLTRAHQVARETHLQHPDQPVVASTYAYSLHVQGRTAEALQVMAGLTQEALEQPVVALYYCLMLAASGDSTNAVPYRKLAERGALLPEEKALLARLGANHALSQP